MKNLYITTSVIALALNIGPWMVANVHASDTPATETREPTEADLAQANAEADKADAAADKADAAADKAADKADAAANKADTIANALDEKEKKEE